MKNFIKQIDLKKVGKITACVVAGVAAVASTLGDQKREAELEAMKKQLSELKGKES